MSFGWEVNIPFLVVKADNEAASEDVDRCGISVMVPLPFRRRCDRMPWVALAVRETG